MSDRPTPETAKALVAILDREGTLFEGNAPEELVTLCRRLERERDTLAEALRECREDSVELLGERGWWTDETQGDYRERYESTYENIRRADAALASINNPNQDAEPIGLVHTTYQP